MRVTPFFANCGYHPYFKLNLGRMDGRTPEILDYISTLTNLHMELRAEIHYAQAS
jgi:galactose mutarotase-like enzyme